MANVQDFYTVSTDVSNNAFSSIWRLTRCMKQAGWTYMASSNGSTVDTTGVAANDKWGGNATPKNDTYPTSFSSTAGPWWVARGPLVVRLNVAVAATGTFTRGEIVTQATSGATGEITGYVFDATNGGWAVVIPQTGTFDGTHVVTGGISGATLTPTSQVTYALEVCIWKNGTQNYEGTVYSIQADIAGEATSFFSYLAAHAAGATAVIAPGGGGTGNSFPVSATCPIGNGGSSSSSNWFGGTSIGTSAHALVAAANATPSAGVSPDATAWVQSSTTTAPTIAGLIGIFRLDDTEPGDVGLWDWFYSQSTQVGSYSRTSSANSPNSTGNTYSNMFAAPVLVSFTGYVARGVGGSPGTAPDIAAAHQMSFPGPNSNAGTNAFTDNTADVLRAQNHPATIKPLAVDTVGLWSFATNAEQCKGRVRWMRYASVGNVFDTLDSRLWTCWVSAGGAAMYIGPWDGATPPTA